MFFKSIILIFLAFALANCIVKIEKSELGILSVDWEIKGDKIKLEVGIRNRTKDLGYIGIGLSRTGGMNGADFMIIKFSDKNHFAIEDMHGLGNVPPVKDLQQDWVLQNHSFSSSTDTQKFIVTRMLQTCDEEDIQISESDNLHVIWAMGTMSSEGRLSYHGPLNRGSFKRTNFFLSEENNIKVVEEPKIWSLRINFTLHSQKTTYVCAIRKSPFLSGKHHLIGFKVNREQEGAAKTLHHMNLWKCSLKEEDLKAYPFPFSTADNFYEHFVSSDIHEGCYDEKTVWELKMPVQVCREFSHAWTIGGEPFYLPESTGYPIGGENSENRHEYFMIESHFDNPTLLDNLEIETGLDIIYTDKLRKYDSGVLMVDHHMVPSHLIPPNTEKFMVPGHCPEEATLKELPQEGINLFAILLHSHNAATKLKLRHFRDGVELPWIAFDDHFAFSYQQTVILQKNVKVLPGDSLVYECTYNTSSRNVVTLAGLGTEDEMCQVFLRYWPQISMWSCGSSTEMSPDFYKLFGVEAVVPWRAGVYDPIVQLPSKFEGLTFSKVLNEILWNETLTKELQEMVLETKHKYFSWHPGNYFNLTNCDTTNLPKVKTKYAPPKCRKEPT